MAAEPDDFDYEQITLSTDLIAAVVDIEDDLTMAGLLSGENAESLRLVPTVSRNISPTAADLSGLASDLTDNLAASTAAAAPRAG